MSKPLKKSHLVSLVAAGVLSCISLWQNGFAQSPQSPQSPQAPQSPGSGGPMPPNNLIVIPSTGYKPAPQTGESKQGKLLFEELNCMACHSIHNTGGDLAPMLDGVGGRRTKPLLVAHLSNAPEDIEAYKRAQSMQQTERWPHPRYSRDKTLKLVEYLMTIPEPPGGFVVMPHTRLPAETPPVVDHAFKPRPISARALEGARLFEKSGCVACHSIGNTGGWLAPHLDGVGARHDQSFILQHISDAQASGRDSENSNESRASRMPRFVLKPDDAQKIVEYLLTLPEEK